MFDSSDEGASSVETARPFLYNPPIAELSGAAAGAPPSVLGGPEYISSSSLSDQTIKAYEKGLLEGETRARAEYERLIAEIRNHISGALRNFLKDRQDYFGRVEGDVVRLSLSIARKILHRESQIDPLLLTGVVHIALQKLNSETRVRLRAHSDEVRFWNEYFKQSKDISVGVEVLGDPSLARGECTLETDFGTTQISLETQLKEIEQGFFDLLEQRPKEQVERV